MRWHCNALTTLPALSLFTAFDKAIDASNIVTLHVPGTDATESLSDLLVCRANDIAFFSSPVAQNIFMYGFISFSSGAILLFTCCLLACCSFVLISPDLHFCTVHVLLLSLGFSLATRCRRRCALCLFPIFYRFRLPEDGAACA